MFYQYTNIKLFPSNILTKIVAQTKVSFNSEMLLLFSPFILNSQKLIVCIFIIAIFNLSTLLSYLGLILGLFRHCFTAEFQLQL